MIISILGTSGAKIDLTSCLPKERAKPAIYDLSLFGKKAESFLNATQFLLQNFDDRFVFIGTECAITFQKALLEDDLKDKDVIFEKVSENDLDEIFEKIYSLLESEDNVMLDVTHGFRHQPIMAIFASTLSQFLTRKSLKIIFAKEEKRFEKYQYVYLDDYIEITQISLLLSGFIRTLNFIPIKQMKLLNNKVFENFSKSLLSNDLKGVEKNYQLLDKELKCLLKKEELRHLHKLIYKISEELSPFKEFDKNSATYEKYLSLGKITVNKNYIVVALAYIFESFREYCTYKFQPLLKDVKIKQGYQTNTAVMDTISNFKRNGKVNPIQKRYPNLYQDNKMVFKRVSTIYKEIRELRNDLAHINLTKNFDDIKLMLNQIIFKIETIYKEDYLSKLQLP